MIPEFVVYSEGLCFASVCSSLGAERTAHRMRSESPSGTENGWCLANEAFASGEPNPCPCNHYPKTHKHYLFEC